MSNNYDYREVKEVYPDGSVIIAHWFWYYIPFLGMKVPTASGLYVVAEMTEDGTYVVLEDSKNE